MSSLNARFGGLILKGTFRLFATSVDMSAPNALSEVEQDNTGISAKQYAKIQWAFAVPSWCTAFTVNLWRKIIVENRNMSNGLPTVTTKIWLFDQAVVVDPATDSSFIYQDLHGQAVMAQLTGITGSPVPGADIVVYASPVGER